MWHYISLQNKTTNCLHPLVLQGAGTEDNVLIEILASRTPEEMKDIIKAYKKGKEESTRGRDSPWTGTPPWLSDKTKPCVLLC